MAKIIIVSKSFLKGHIKQGYPTLFVEKIMAGIADNNPEWKIPKDFVLYNYHEYYTCHAPKFHTIRKGNRFKVGDKASLRIWSGMPYRSKQVEFAQVEIKKTWDIEMIPALWFDECQWLINGKQVTKEHLQRLSINDGLDLFDFMVWFCGPNSADSKRKGFKGQIICWNENV